MIPAMTTGFPVMKKTGFFPVRIDLQGVPCKPYISLQCLGLQCAFANLSPILHLCLISAEDVSNMSLSYWHFLSNPNSLNDNKNNELQQQPGLTHIPSLFGSDRLIQIL